jgi:hypothetical protein
VICPSGRSIDLKDDFSSVITGLRQGAHARCAIAHRGMTRQGRK